MKRRYCPLLSEEKWWALLVVRVHLDSKLPVTGFSFHGNLVKLRLNALYEPAGLFMMRNNCFWLNVLLAMLTATCVGSEYHAGDWKLSVSLVPDSDSLTFGEPVWLSFKVENLSDDDLSIIVGGDYRNQFGRPDSFKIKVLGKDGAAVASREVMTFGGIVAGQSLPAKKSYVFRLLLSDWVKIDAPGTYTISASRTLSVLKPAPRESLSGKKESAVNVETEEKATITIAAADQKRLGEVILELTNSILLKKENINECQKGLASITDERVIPMMLKILAMQDYSTKFFAITNLSRYDTPETVAALKSILDIKATDLSNRATRPELLETLVTNLRSAAVHGLAESKQPEVRDYLLKNRNDPMNEFRLTVVHMLGRTKSDEAKAILKEMTKDSHEPVRSEALRYLKQFGEEPKQ
jgi:hypothetical protein